VSGATVSGSGTAEIGDGILKIQAVGYNQNVTFREHQGAVSISPIRPLIRRRSAARSAVLELGKNSSST